MTIFNLMNKIDGIKCQDNYKIIFLLWSSVMCMDYFFTCCLTLLREGAGMNDDPCCAACCQDTSTITTEDTTNDKNKKLLGQVHVENPITGNSAPTTKEIIR